MSSGSIYAIIGWFDRCEFVTPEVWLTADGRTDERTDGQANNRACVAKPANSADCNNITTESLFQFSFSFSFVFILLFLVVNKSNVASV